MSLYKGTDLISGHQVLYSTTGQNTDGAMTQKATSDVLDIKANTSLSNLDSIGKKVIDGQWVYSTTNIASNVTAPTSTSLEYSLSSYLPNDNYIYEVLIDVIGVTGSTSGNQQRINLQTQIISTQMVFYGNTRTSSTQALGGCTCLPVGTNRKLRVKAWSSNTGTFTIDVRGYRRLGTNS